MSLQHSKVSELRTVMVPNCNVEAAYHVLNRILTMDGIIDKARQQCYYEKPCRRRQREAYKACRSIYNMEMTRKINFVACKNHADPWIGFSILET